MPKYKNINDLHDAIDRLLIGYMVNSAYRLLSTGCPVSWNRGFGPKNALGSASDRDRIMQVYLSTAMCQVYANLGIT